MKEAGDITYPGGSNRPSVWRGRGWPGQGLLTHRTCRDEEQTRMEHPKSLERWVTHSPTRKENDRWQEADISCPSEMSLSLSHTVEPELTDWRKGQVSSEKDQQPQGRRAGNGSPSRCSEGLMDPWTVHLNWTRSTRGGLSPGGLGRSASLSRAFCPSR